MELSAIMLQLEMREKELIKYGSRPLSAFMILVYQQKCTTVSCCCYSGLADMLLFIHPASLQGYAVHRSLTLMRFRVEWSCHRASSRGTCTWQAFATSPCWMAQRRGPHFMKELDVNEWELVAPWGSKVATASGLRYSWECQENFRVSAIPAAT